MKTPIPANLSAALHTYGIRPYESKSSYPDRDAKQNLRGRTHYVDDDTLRCFEARILGSGMFAPGHDSYELSDALVYWIVESVNSRPDHGGRNKRFVAFDIFGTIITRGDFEDTAEWHRTTDAARKAGLASLADLDPVKHTRDALKARCKADKEQVRATLAALREPAAVA